MLWFNFILGSTIIIILCMVMYDNKYKTKGKKLNHNTYKSHTELACAIRMPKILHIHAVTFFSLKFNKFNSEL